MTQERQPLTDRIRIALAVESAREVRMFGCLAFMVNGKMVVAVRKDDGLLVRIDPARSSELLAQPGAAQAEMGAGRSMGPGWLEVDRAALTDKGLEFWLGVALEYNARA